jgi:hypothetical protein
MKCPYHQMLPTSILRAQTQTPLVSIPGYVPGAQNRHLARRMGAGGGHGHGGPAHSTTQDRLPTTSIQHIPVRTLNYAADPEANVGLQGSEDIGSWSGKVIVVERQETGSVRLPGQNQCNGPQSSGRSGRTNAICREAGLHLSPRGPWCEDGGSYRN